MVEVLVAGAVVKQGHHLMPEPATIQAALDAAGGLAHFPHMWAAGPITVRRPSGNRKVDVWRFNFNDSEPQPWRSFELQSGDLLVFAWQLKEFQPEEGSV
jgi:hypothetical protein